MTRSYLVLFCLVLSWCVAHGQDGECEESELGYVCKKQMTDYYALHWSLGPTTQGGEAEEGEIAMAMVGETAGWVGFAFAEEAGSMAPADFVIGWVDGGDVVVNPYRSEIQAIAETNEDASVTLTGTEGAEVEEGGSTFTTIRFVRSLTEGTAPILLDAEIPVNVAVGDDDSLVYHGVTRLPTTVMLSLGQGETMGTPPAPEPTPEVPAPVEVPAVEPVAEAPAPEDEDGATQCTPSSLGFACMMEAGPVTVHWTVGPADSAGTILLLSAGEIGMAISAETAGYVAVSFAQDPGLMIPADVILGWVADDDVDIRAYAISDRAITTNDESEDIGLQPISGTEEDGVTTLEFILDGTFTFPVNFEEEVDMNWAVGEGDVLEYHGTNRGSFTIDFSASPLDTNGGIAEVPGEPDVDELDLDDL